MASVIYKYIALIVILLLFGCNAHSYAQTREIEQQKTKIEKIEKDIEFLDAQIKATRNKESKTLGELVLIRKKIEDRKELLLALDGEIKAQTQSINEKEEHIAALGKRLDSLKGYYSQLVQSAYKNRDSKLWFMYILASSSIEQAYRRWGYLKNYSKLINEQATRAKATQEKILQEKEDIIKLKASNISAQAAQQKEYNQLKQEEKQANLYAQSLSTKQKEFKAQLTKKQSEAKELANKVEKMIKEAIRKEELLKAQANKRIAQQKAEKKTVAPAINTKLATNTKLSGDFAANKGKLPFPVSKGVIIEKFGEHYHPTLKNVKLPFNNGVNISTTGGADVMAVFDGEIKQIIAIPGYNQCILVQHGSYFTFYCKLDKVIVKAGDKVKTGETLGSLHIDNNTSVLHFELWNGTAKQNPELWLKK